MDASNLVRENYKVQNLHFKEIEHIETLDGDIIRPTEDQMMVYFHDDASFDGWVLILNKADGKEIQRTFQYSIETIKWK